MAADSKKIRKQLLIMLGIVLGMFAFCFALVPVYNVFCQVTGLNGKTVNAPFQDATRHMRIDESRTVTVELLATLNGSIPNGTGEFTTPTKKFTIHPGELITTTYWVKNTTPAPVVVQAIPSVTPGVAARHIKKWNVFVFKTSRWIRCKGKEMPLVFTVDPAIPANIGTVTLAYTLFDVTQH